VVNGEVFDLDALKFERTNERVSWYGAPFGAENPLLAWLVDSVLSEFEVDQNADLQQLGTFIRLHLEITPKVSTEPPPTIIGSGQQRRQTTRALVEWAYFAGIFTRVWEWLDGHLVPCPPSAPASSLAAASRPRSAEGKVSDRQTARGSVARIESPGKSNVYAVPMKEVGSAFAECWRAAGSHLNKIGQHPLMDWLKADLTPPFLEHLSFRLGNQLFFVRVEDVEGRVDGPGSVKGLLSIASGCKGWPCIMPMRSHQEGWKPDRPGWGLIDARTGDAIDPLALITEERIEMTDWEVQDFAVQVVRDALKQQGNTVLSSQGNPNVDPSIWFMENGLRAWVVVRAVRFPELAATVPHNWRQIAKGCVAVSEVGYFASVAIAGGEERQGERPDTRLLRGYPLYVKETSLKEPTEGEIDAAEKHRRQPIGASAPPTVPGAQPERSNEIRIDQKTGENDAEWGNSIDYFAPSADPKLDVLRKIKGNTRRAFVADAIASDGLASIPPGWLAHDLSDALKAVLGAQNPRARGGEDLPDLEADEVEIARLTLANSVHGEVSSLRARRDPRTKLIMFRMVDEYETPITLPFSRAPAALTAGQVVQLFVESEPSQTETTCRIDFQSDFYPGLNDLARSRGLQDSVGVTDR